MESQAVRTYEAHNTTIWLYPYPSSEVVAFTAAQITGYRRSALSAFACGSALSRRHPDRQRGRT